MATARSSDPKVHLLRGHASHAVSPQPMNPVTQQARRNATTTDASCYGSPEPSASANSLMPLLPIPKLATWPTRVTIEL